MTTIYFIRHAQSDNSVHDDKIRPLTPKGLNDRILVSDFLQNKEIDIVLSSPYKRTIDTVNDFAQKAGIDIELVNDFRERRISTWIDDFNTFSACQWDDFTFKIGDGECLAEVQKRNIDALNEALIQHSGKNIVIGTHGTALSTIINYYDNTYGYEDFNAMVNIMPWVVKMSFNGLNCMGMQKIDLFNLDQEPDYEKRKVRIQNLGSLKAYRFVVIFARYHDKWLYCRAKTRDTFETAGGHVEDGESTLEAAKRELYEETGAHIFSIEPLFDYSVHIPTEYSNGQVFLAHIQELDSIPDYEMAEIKLFDSIPDNMRFPQILPVLYNKVVEMIQP